MPPRMVVNRIAKNREKLEPLEGLSVTMAGRSFEVGLVALV